MTNDETSKGGQVSNDELRYAFNVNLSHENEGAERFYGLNNEY